MATRTSKKRSRKPRAEPAPSISSGSLGEWPRYLVGNELDEPDWIPVWPPDAFAIAAAFLRRTGAYIDLVNGANARHWSAARDASISSPTPATQT